MFRAALEPMLRIRLTESLHRFVEGSYLRRERQIRKNRQGAYFLL